jgi:hypothetical protein
MAVVDDCPMPTSSATVPNLSFSSGPDNSRRWLNRPSLSPTDGGRGDVDLIKLMLFYAVPIASVVTVLQHGPVRP